MNKRLLGLSFVLMLVLTGCGNKKLVTCESSISGLPSQLTKAEQKLEIEFNDSDKITKITMTINATIADSVDDSTIKAFKESQEATCKTGIDNGTYKTCSTTLNGKNYTMKAEYPTSGIDELNKELPDEYKKAQDGGFKGNVQEYFAEYFQKSQSGMTCKVN